MKPERTQQYRDRVTEILGNAARYHGAYYAAGTFRGPSLHFHRRCISLLGEPLTPQRIELIYATLASWGMHRMGKGGSKMLPFEDFVASLAPVGEDVSRVAAFAPATMTEDAWVTLRRVFRGIRVMATGTVLVGNSKVLAHLVPAVVTPIDREYTLRYLLGTTTIRNDPESEWALMRELLERFFHPVARDDRFRAQATAWVARQSEFPWDTSVLKVVDNLVIGACKLAGIKTVDGEG